MTKEEFDKFVSDLGWRYGEPIKSDFIHEDNWLTKKRGYRYFFIEWPNETSLGGRIFSDGRIQMDFSRIVTNSFDAGENLEASTVANIDKLIEEDVESFHRYKGRGRNRN